MFKNTPVSIRKENPSQIPHLVTQYNIRVQIERFFDGLFKGFTDMVKCKSGPYVPPGEEEWVLLWYNGHKK